MAAAASGVLLLAAGCGSAQGARAADAASSTRPAATASARVGDVAVTGFAIPAPPSSGYPRGGDVEAQLEVTDDAQGDALTSASSPDAARVRLFDFGRPVERISVPGEAQDSDDDNLQLVDLRRTLTAGDEVRVTLRFAQAGSVTVRVPVQFASQ